VLKNSEIEPPRKSRFRLRRVIGSGLPEAIALLIDRVRALSQGLAPRNQGASGRDARVMDHTPPRREYSLITGANARLEVCAEDALFAADDGTVAVWMLRCIETSDKRRTFAGLLHGTLAVGMPSAFGLQRSQPGRRLSLDRSRS
jgi:thiamine pyrophosphate-dependent acetolactate synthase large subunit-like protein